MNWPQLKTILWLRWRLTRNQWAKGGGIGAAFAAIVAVVTIGMSIIGLGAGFAVGVYALHDARPDVIMFVWFGLTAAFLLFWIIGLISELQRSETIDLQRLMHLPVQLGQIFVVNYVASLLAISVLLYVPASVGLGVGLAISRGPRMLLMIPLALSMVFMVSSWTYLLRGWLATLMNNPRRRRAIVMGLTMTLILIAQAPNIYFNLIKRSDRKARRAESQEQRDARQAQELSEFQALLRWQVAVPPLWVSAGAQPLVEGRPLPAVLGLLGCVGVGVLGLRRAYRSTLRFYTGDSGGAAPAASTAQAPASRAGRDSAAFLERGLPGVPEHAAAVAVASFRTMLRAPELKMQWGTSFIVTLLVGGSLLFRKGTDLPAAASPFIATGVVVFQMFLMVGLVANQFGLDRDGFRAFVLSPVERWKILFGKNLAAFPVASGAAVVLVTALAIWLRLSPLAYVATLLQLVVAVLCAAMAGNLLSILVPYRIQPGSMKPTKMPALATLVFVVTQMSLPAALSPTFIPPLAGYLAERAGYAPAALVNLLLSSVLAAAIVFIYWLTLAPTGRLLHRRETKILQTVSESVE
ncbi:MAG TPA: ABC transporter permease [Vicinamibacterales bacterium]|nr:ABC transporter permease [Vicinamibacterales bacterium]